MSHIKHQIKKRTIPFLEQERQKKAIQAPSFEEMLETKSVPKNNTTAAMGPTKKREILVISIAVSSLK